MYLDTLGYGCLRSHSKDASSKSIPTQAKMYYFLIPILTFVLNASLGESNFYINKISYHL